MAKKELIKNSIWRMSKHEGEGESERKEALVRVGEETGWEGGRERNDE